MCELFASRKPAVGVNTSFMAVYTRRLLHWYSPLCLCYHAHHCRRLSVSGSDLGVALSRQLTVGVHAQERLVSAPHSVSFWWMHGAHWCVLLAS